jgi:hypothetical protein
VGSASIAGDVNSSWFKPWVRAACALKVSSYPSMIMANWLSRRFRSSENFPAHI